MRIATVTLESVSPYSQSRNYEKENPKHEKEGNDAYRDRTWRSHLHVTEDGHVFVPPTALKNAISECAKYLGVQIPGKGKQNYTKHIEAGVLVSEPMVLPIKAESVSSETLHLPSDGRRGGGKRVWKTYPLIPKWKGDATFYVLDDVITQEVFEYHLRQAGQFIGIGRFRPRNNGFYGRFEINKVKWSEQ